VVVRISIAPTTAYAGEQLPKFSKLRFNEEYSEVQKKENNYFNSIKRLSLSNTSNAYVSIGGEARLRYEYTNNPSFGEDVQDKYGVFLQRYTIHADLHLNEKFRFFTQVVSALETGRNRGASPVDENKLEFQNVFIDYLLDTKIPHPSTLRLGRQEIDLGSGRLVDVREGPNVRRTFDGIQVILKNGEWDSSIFALRPRITNLGAFDDEFDKEKSFWGVYMMIPYRKKVKTLIDFYYIGFKDESSVYDQGTKPEKRHSLGTRLSGEMNSWNYNWEYIYQFGTFGAGNIHAWSLATITGYQWKNIYWQPHIALSVNIASGDKNRNNSDLESFNAIFPRGNYFSEAAVLGPRNFYNFHPFLTIHPDNNWSITADINFFWRKETSDGLYSPSGQLIRSSTDNNERYVGSSASLNSEWLINRNVSLTAIYSHWVPSGFLKATGSSESIDFFEFTVQYRF